MGKGLLNHKHIHSYTTPILNMRSEIKESLLFDSRPWQYGGPIQWIVSMMHFWFLPNHSFHFHSGFGWLVQYFYGSQSDRAIR